jgi:hypothetical protein
MKSKWRMALASVFLTAFGFAVFPVGSASVAQALTVEIFGASGPDAAAITPSLNLFRTELGMLNPNVAGSFGTGRREINWDAVPPNFSAPNLLPNDFFNVNSPRGTVFSTPGTGVAVSANAAEGQYGLATSTRIIPRCFKRSVHRSYSPQSARTL